MRQWVPEEASVHETLTKILHPSSEIVVYPTISEIVYQNIALYQMGRLEITKMVEE